MNYKPPWNHFAVSQCEDLKVKYSEEQTKRRKLYNQVQEAKGMFNVHCSTQFYKISALFIIRILLEGTNYSC